MEADELIHCFVASLTRSVSLRVVGRGSSVFDPSEYHQMFPEPRHKQLVPV